MRLLVTCTHLIRHIDAFMSFLAGLDIDVRVADVAGQHLDEDEMVPLVGDVDAIIAGDDVVSRRVLEAGVPQLRIVSKWGIGMDAIDLGAARELGVEVINTPGMFGDEVADVAVGYLLGLSQRLFEIDRGVRTGAWPKPAGRSLRGERAVVVGLGSVGRAIVKRLEPLALDVVGCETVPEQLPAPWRAGDRVRIEPLETALIDATAVILACNLTADNVHMISRPQLRAMSPDGFLVNVARGPLVNTEALIEALDQGRLGGVALDVYEEEPLPHPHPLRTHDRVVLGSHNASNTVEAVDRVNRESIRNVLRALGVEWDDDKLTHC